MEYNKQHVFSYAPLSENEIDNLKISSINLKTFILESRKKYVHSVHDSIKSQTKSVMATAKELPDLCLASVIEGFCYDVKVGSSVFKADWREIYKITQQEISDAIVLL